MEEKRRAAQRRNGRAMAYQSIFRRYEMKFLISEAQAERICREVCARMQPDAYGRTVIRNLYYDTPNYRLIRRSMEKPEYKEKLRLRAYAQAGEDSQVFAEIKKKYRGVVYKRRLALPEAEAMGWLSGTGAAPAEGQIQREIDRFLAFYGGLAPRVFLSYAREAYVSRTEDFRVTFDREILCRQTELSLRSPPAGDALLSPGEVLMELKCGVGIPLWMCEILSREKIRRTPYSKYGTAYAKYIFPQHREEIFHA